MLFLHFQSQKKKYCIVARAIFGVFRDATDKSDNVNDETDSAGYVLYNSLISHCWLGDMKGIWPAKTMHQNPLAR